MDVAPTPDAEELVLAPYSRGDAHMVLPAARNAVEHLGGAERVDFAAQVLRREEGRRENYRADDEHPDRRGLYPLRPAQLGEIGDEGMEEVDDRARRHEEDRRAREGVERGVEEDRGRYEEVVGRPELARANWRPARDVLHLPLLAHLFCAMAPEGNRDAEEQREVVAGHVGIAEGREEVPDMPHDEPACLAPQWSRGVHRVLHEAEHGERGAVPHRQLEH